MRWPWTKRKLPDIPTAPPAPVRMIEPKRAQNPGFEVKEVRPPPGVTETGVFKAWQRGERLEPESLEKPDHDPKG